MTILLKMWDATKSHWRHTKVIRESASIRCTHSIDIDTSANSLLIPRWPQSCGWTRNLGQTKVRWLHPCGHVVQWKWRKQVCQNQAKTVDVVLWLWTAVIILEELKSWDRFVLEQFFLQFCSVRYTDLKSNRFDTTDHKTTFSKLVISLATLPIVNRY